LITGDKFTDSGSGTSIHHNPTSGPRFDGGADMAINDKSNVNNSYANIGSSFINSNYTKGTK